MKEKNWFFKLSDYTEELKNMYENQEADVKVDSRKSVPKEESLDFFLVQTAGDFPLMGGRISQIEGGVFLNFHEIFAL